METNQQNQDEIEIDLLELLRVLCSKIGYVILAALALGLLMVLVSKVLMKPQYESTTKMYVLSKQDSSNTVTSGDLQASSLLTKDYAELIQSRQVVETVIAQLNLDLTYEQFLNKLTVTTQNDTRILSITVKDEDPYMASQIADAIRVAAADHIQNVFICFSGQLFVRFFIDMLDINKKKIGILHQLLEFGEKWFFSGKRTACSINRCVNTFCLCFFKKIQQKINLKERFSAAYGDSTAIFPVSAVTQSLRKKLIGTAPGGAVFICHIPGVRVMAELTSQWTSLNKYNKTYPRSVNRTKAFCRVNKSFDLSHMKISFFIV